MTISCPEVDGDSHESSAHWLGMTMLFEALTYPCKFQFLCLLGRADMDTGVFVRGNLMSVKAQKEIGRGKLAPTPG